MTTKDTIKKLLPNPVVSAIRETRDWFTRLGEWPSTNFHPCRLDTNRRLRLLKNRYSGKRCFILGNGPSLRNTDLTKLKNEFTFGMNRIYLLYPELGFNTSFYLSINDLVIEQCAEDIQKLSIPRFVSWRSHSWLKPDTNLFFLNTSYTGPRFARNATERLWEGATVTYVALQLAFYLGFETVILIGVDHNFTTRGKPNATVVSQGDDPNHFSPSYFGKGFKWQLPDLETSERSYRMALNAYQKTGRKVIDATVGGKLTVFPKVDYDSLF